MLANKQKTDSFYAIGLLFTPRSVHLDARLNPSWNVIYLFRALAISCNKLHATIYDFLVACILMHDQITHGTK